MRFGEPECTAVITTDRRVRMIMKELSKQGNQGNQGNQGRAAAESGAAEREPARRRAQQYRQGPYAPTLVNKYLKRM